uniref:Cysteine-rich venom protein pseudechetoxin-like n=1 Tax=Mastacembelus armatus TaxID=205130 RepID=A0A3Q3M0S4_9TELE
MMLFDVKMFAFVICILTLHHVHSACILAGICPNNKNIQAEIADIHNAFRREVQPTASDMLIMYYSEEIAASAQAWVENCKMSHGPPASRMFNGYELGENLFHSQSIYPWSDVIRTWHSEVTHYQYPNGSKDGKPIGHYTQVVWNTSYKVGCGVALCSNVYFYGCHYYRAGNFVGWPPYKAGTPCASCPNACEDKLCNNPCPFINTYSNCSTLKILNGCEDDFVHERCPASCRCTTEIIPIG